MMYSRDASLRGISSGAAIHAEPEDANADVDI
jgi:hypothetical protein